MNPLVKFLPLLSNTRMLSNQKKWLVLVAAVVSMYQLFSPNGVGANWGIPSFDTFYAEPRDILINRVEAASDAQQETAEEFKSALAKFKQVTNFDGGELERKLNTLSKAYDRSEDASRNVTQRVDRVVTATNNLLDEWRDELKQYHDDSIRGRAEAQFDETRVKAEKLIAVMRNAESKTKPVLGALKDQVLFVKHNLNMQAISSIKQETTLIEQNVSALIKEMEASISEAESFIKSIRN
ncbi:MAG: hypothetical protein ACI9SP_002121 [Arenicella sp.]|jgi:hypothetical protein